MRHARFLSVILAFGGVLTLAPSTTQAALYAPGATLDPACAPTDSDCGVQTSVGTGTPGQVPYYAANGSILSATSSLTILANGTIGIGTTTPNWLLQIAGTRPSLALSDTSATANLKHWLFSSMGGNLYIGTSTDAYATSTPSAFTILNNGKVGIGTTSPISTLSVVGVNGGGTPATRATSATINAPTGLYDVGLRINTYDHVPFDYGTYSALDLDLRSTTGAGGDAMRIFTNIGGTRAKAAYFANDGALYTRVGVIISGTYANSGVNQGEDTTITPASNEGNAMLSIWQDVQGGIQTRAGNVANPWVWEGLDRNGNKTSSIEEDGTYKFGAGSTHASLDLGLKRVSAGVLEINNGTAGVYRDLNLRNLISSGIASSTIFYTGNGTVSAPSYSFSNFPGSGMFVESPVTNGGIFFAANGGEAVFGAVYNQFRVNPNYPIGWSASSPISTSVLDTGFSRLSANKIGVGNGLPFDTSGTLIAGNIGVGTTSPYSLFSISNSATTVANTSLFSIASTTNGTATTTVFSVASTGNVTINGSSGSTCTIGNGTGGTSCTSDERLKTNVALIVDPLKSIEQLRGVTFNWADPAKDQTQFIGVIAQDVQKVFPQAVSITDAGYLSVDYSSLVAPLIEAVKELAGRVSSLTATVSGFTQKFTTNELCVGSTCLTESQLKTILQNNEQQAGSPSATDSNATATAVDTEGINTASSTNTALTNVSASTTPDTQSTISTDLTTVP